LQLQGDQAEANVDLQESALWAQRQGWIHDHQPPLGDEGGAKAAVLDYVVKGAHDNKLDVLDQNLNDVEHGAAGTRVNVSVKVKGSLEDMVKWLAPLQTPDQFYAISSFSLQADPDMKSYICTLRIARYFKEGS
jgi:hypothetical protein